MLAFCAALIGASGLLGWLLGVPALQSVLPALSAMRANVALGLMAAGSGLLLIPERGGGGWRLRLALAAGTLACLLGLLTLAEHVSRIPLGLDQRLAGDPNTTTPIDPSRMSPATAAALGCTVSAHPRCWSGLVGRPRRSA
jgi:hypothetical protein